MKILNYKFVNGKKLSGVYEELNSVKKEVSGATAFVKEIEKGNLDADIKNSGTSTELIQSLAAMRDQMKKFSLEEKQRSWINEGLAKFVEILRSKNENLQLLSDNIVRQLVTYIKANQGALYLVNDDNPDDVFIEMQACYAYNRKKNLKQRIELGQGLAGQAVLEKETIILTDVPKDFVKITSGLGEALPRNILVVPLKLEDKVLGILELASFQVLKKFEIEFIEKIGESIASTISSVKVSERTALLLQSTQQQTEEMKSQEEEMRQNMEELTATQEEMRRILKEVEGKEAYISSLLNVSSDLIFTIDKQYKLVTWNRSMSRSMEGFGVRFEKGLDTMSWYPDDQKDQQRRYYERAFDGESFEITTPSVQNGTTYHFLSVYAPLRNEQGQIYEVAVFANDVTAMISAQQKAELLRQEAQTQTDALKAQEEELRQNMEELSATQDEMQRILKEVENKEAYVSAVLNVTTDSIFTVDKEYKLVTWNKAMARSLEGFNMQLEKGNSTLDWFQGEEKNKQIDLYKKVFEGEHIEFTSPTEINGETYHFLSVYAPLRNEKGEVYEVAVFAKDVTKMMRAQHTAEKLMADAKNQAEELRAQEEELRQNMEELSTTQEEMQRILTEVQSRETFISNLIDASKDSILAVDKNLHIVNCNAVFQKTYSAMGLEFAKGSDIRKIFNDPAEVARYESMYARAFVGEAFDIEERYSVGTSEMYCVVSYLPLYNASNEVDTVAVFVKDVTAITLAKLEAERQREDIRVQADETNRLREDLEAREKVFSLTTLLSEADIYGTITYVNSKFCEISGYTPEELIGKPHSILRHPDMPKEFFKRMWSTIKKGKPFQGIVKNKAKNGTHYWVDASIVPIKDAKGNIVKYIGARYHITNEELASQLFKEQFPNFRIAS